MRATTSDRYPSKLNQTNSSQPRRGPCQGHTEHGVAQSRAGAGPARSRAAETQNTSCSQAPSSCSGSTARRQLDSRSQGSGLQERPAVLAAPVHSRAVCQARAPRERCVMEAEPRPASQEAMKTAISANSFAGPSSDDARHDTQNTPFPLGHRAGWESAQQVAGPPALRHRHAARPL